MAEGAQDALVFDMGAVMDQAATGEMVARRSTDHLGGAHRATRPRGSDPVIRERMALSDPHAHRHDYDGHSHAGWRQSDGTEARNHCGNRFASREGATSSP